ncbi:MAG: ATP-binding protein [Gemmatimonadales bacterium]
MSAERSRVALSWSGGKDAAWALHRLRGRPDVEVVALVTTVVSAFGRVAMHGVRAELVRAQARAAGVELVEVPLSWPSTNAEYEQRVGAALAELRRGLGVTHVAFGDLFLADVRAYRERMLEGTGLTPLFPLWLEPTGRLMERMLSEGVEARIVCLDPQRIGRELAGRALDAGLLSELPGAVDPCGERGEFHTFVSAGPMLSEPVRVAPGEIVEREGFVYADLLPI